MAFIGFTPVFPGAASTPNAITAANLPFKGNGISNNAKYPADFHDKLSKVQKLPNPHRNPLLPGQNITNNT